MTILAWNCDDFVMEMWLECTFFLALHLNFPSTDCSALWCMKKEKLKQITDNVNAPNVSAAFSRDDAISHNLSFPIPFYEELWQHLAYQSAKNAGSRKDTRTDQKVTKFERHEALKETPITKCILKPGNWIYAAPLGGPSYLCTHMGFVIAPIWRPSEVRNQRRAEGSSGKRVLGRWIRLEWGNLRVRFRWRGPKINWDNWHARPVDSPGIAPTF